MVAGDYDYYIYDLVPLGHALYYLSMATVYDAWIGKITALREQMPMDTGKRRVGQSGPRRRLIGAPAAAGQPGVPPGATLFSALCPQAEHS